MKRRRNRSLCILCLLLAALLLPLLCLPVLAEEETEGGNPFDDVVIVIPDDGDEAETYEGEAPRSGVNWLDLGGDYDEGFYLEYSVMGGSNFTKKYQHTGNASVVAKPGETVTIAYKTCTPYWPFAIPWAKWEGHEEDFEDLYKMENYVETCAYYVSNTLKPEYADRESCWDSTYAYEEYYISPQNHFVITSDTYSGSLSVTVPSDIAERIFIRDNGDPPVITLYVGGGRSIVALGEDERGMESSFGVGFSVRILLDVEAAVPVTGIVQDVTEYAMTETGEDPGTVIDPGIVEGEEPIHSSTLPAILISIGGTAATAAAAAALSGGKKKRSTYKMCVSKGFGDVIRKGAAPCWVYARIVEITPEGAERDRPDLTQKIIPFSGDGSLAVADGGMSGGYKAAQVSAPKETSGSQGRVSFQYQGPGGLFTKHVIFSLSEGRINFGQENLGLPAHYEKEVRLYFTVSDMPANIRVTTGFSPESKAPYSVKLLQDRAEPRCYCVVLKDTSPKDEAEPGTTRCYRLHVKATAAVPGGGTDETERDFEIYRIFMGLSLQLEADAIGCYLLIKDGRREMAAKRAAGTNLGLELTSAEAALNPLGTMMSSGVGAMVGASLGTDIRDEDRMPCITKGSLLLLNWNDETQQIERIAVYPEKSVTVTALRVENDKYSRIGEAGEKYQRIVEGLCIRVFPTKDLDEKTQGRIVKLCSTKAGLDKPTRLRALLTVRAVYEGKTYEVKKKVLLHSMPFRSYQNETARQQQLGYDERVRKFLVGMQDEIWDHYMNRLSSLYYMAGRMVDGYDPNFGYDQKQLDRMIDYWHKFRRGEVQGKNGEPVKVTIADDLAACVAFIEGMRDNGGIIGRIALGVCTAGYSEVLFFGMELHDKMKEAVFACKGDEFGFWDGVALGLKEYEKQVALELLVGGTLKLGNSAIGRVTGVDLAATISNNWRGAMNAADQALRSKSTLYKFGARTLDGVQAFMNGGASAYKEAMERAAREDAAIKGKATTIAQRRTGDLGLSPKQMKDMKIHDTAMSRGMDKVRDLWKAELDLSVARKNGNYEEALEAYEKAWEKVKFDKNAFKQLKNYSGPQGQTMRAKFTEVRQLHDQRILDRMLDEISAETGIPRNELYVEKITGHADAWKETAGLTLSEDLDVNVRQVVYSDRGGHLVTAADANYTATGNDLIVRQKIGEDALARNVYREFHGGMDAPSLEAAKQYTKRMDYTYVQPWQGLEGDLEITFNQEAFIELDKVIDPGKFKDPLLAKRMSQLTVEHKAMEWRNSANEFTAEAEALERQAETLTGAERQAALDEAMDLHCQAHGDNVESVRQLTKAGDNMIAPRSEFKEGQGLGKAYTDRAKDMVGMGRELKNGEDPEAYFDYLQSEHGVSYEQAVKEVAACLE